MKPTIAYLLLVSLGACLTACSDRDGSPEAIERPSQSEPVPRGGLAGEAEPTASSDIADVRGGFGSRYTDLDLADCEQTDRTEEGASATWRCPGLDDATPLIVHTGDGRFDIDAGADNGRWESILAFNDLPNRVEWRMEGDAPVAIIYRLEDVSGMAGPRTVLLVEKPGAEGCLVGRVAGSAPDANEEARRIAERASGFDCISGQPTEIGDAG